MTPSSPAPSKRLNQSSATAGSSVRSEEHTSELQSRLHLACRLPLEKKNLQAAFARCVVMNYAIPSSSIACPIPPPIATVAPALPPSALTLDHSHVSCVPFTLESRRF